MSAQLPSLPASAHASTGALTPPPPTQGATGRPPSPFQQEGTAACAKLETHRITPDESGCCKGVAKVVKEWLANMPPPYPSDHPAHWGRI